jgi:hypothetical protein
VSVPIQVRDSARSGAKSLKSVFTRLKPKQAVTGALDKVAPGNLARVVEEKLRAGADEVAYSIEKRDARDRVAAKGVGKLPSSTEAQDLLTWMSAFMGTQLTIVDALLTTLGELAALEVVRETGHGKRLLDGATKLRVIRGGIELRQSTTVTLLGALADEADDADAALLTRAAVHQSVMVEFVSSLSGNLLEVQTTCTHALTFEQVKAIVTNPDEKRYRASQKSTELAIQIVDQGIGAIEAASSVVATVPDAHAKAAASAVNLSMMIVKIVKAPLARLATSFAVRRDMTGFTRGEALGQEFREHEKDPLLIAGMLGRKRLKDVEMVLSMVADPLMKQLGDLSPAPPVVKKAWEAVRATVTATVKAYQDERIALARAALPPRAGAKPAAKDTDAFEKLAFDVLDGMKKKLEKNIFLAMDPMGLALSGVISALAKRIAALIVDALPVDPAQAIDGSAIFAHMDAITNTVRLVVDTRPLPVGPQCPTHTALGDVVGVVLSEAVANGSGHQWRVALASGETGLVRDDTSFTPDPDDDEADDLPPTVDATGIRLTTVLVSTRQVTPARDDEDDVRVSYAAQVDEVRGRLRRTSLSGATSWKFVVDRTVPVDPTRYANWSQRFLVPPGVREPEGYVDKVSGTTMRGRWFRPVGTSGAYLFVNESTGAWEWAHATAAVGNRPGARVVQVLDAVAYDPMSDLEILLLASS